MMERIRKVSPRFRARLAGGLYLFTLLASQLVQSLFPGKFNLAAEILEIVGMSAVTLLLYVIFAPVNRGISLLAALLNFTGIALEATRSDSHGMDIAMVFHGFFCILIGYLIFRSAFVPRSLGTLSAFGGLAWLTYLAPSLANYLSPFNVVCGLLGEASLFLWWVGTGGSVVEGTEQPGDVEASLLRAKPLSLARTVTTVTQPGATQNPSHAGV
jgi:uncharacterized protein DUF4386